MAAPRPIRAMYNHFKVFSGTANLPLAQEICDSLGCPLGSAMIRSVRGRRNPSADPGKCQGRGRFCCPAHLHARRSQPDGIAADDRRAEAGQCGAHHGSVTLLWIRAAGPKRQAAYADFGQAGRQSARDGRGQPGSGSRSSRRADSGILRYSCRSLVCSAGDGGVF